MSPSTIAVFLAPGFEEIEALGTVDILRRGGHRVVTAASGGASSFLVTGAHQITVTADCMARDLNPADLLMTICPGGMPGATNLREDSSVTSLISAVIRQGGKAGAICAAPIVLASIGLLTGRRFTCYPSFEKQIGLDGYTAQPVTIDGPIITGAGPGATFDFAMAILQELGKTSEECRQLQKGMIIP